MNRTTFLIVLCLVFENVISNCPNENPEFIKSPNIQQIDLKTVRVSWNGIIKGEFF